MKILLITFSGTSNTFICGEFLKKHLESLNHQVDHYLYNARREFNYNLDEFDLIGIGYPIHAFNVPKPFFKFLISLKVNKKIDYFIYKVSGEPFVFNSASSATLNSKLKKKGFNLVYEKHFLMPYNIMFNYNDSIKKEMYLYLEKLTLVTTKMLTAKEYNEVTYNPFYRFISFIFRIEWIAGPLNSKITHVDMKKCISCYKCVKECPTKSLYIDKNNKIKIKTNCCICMKCAHDCPKDAFVFGFLNPWRVNGKFDYQKLLKDENNKGNYINKNTKGYFKLFRKYFKNQNELLKKYNIEIPEVFIKDELL